MSGDPYTQAWWGSWWPWAEANQGFLSVLALVAALILFLIEQRAANDARAAAAAADADRVRSDLALENERRALALEAERRERAAGVEAERRALERELQKQIDAANQYVETCEKLVDPLINSLSPEPVLVKIGDRSRIDGKVTFLASELADALAEVIRAAPLSPGVIVGSKRQIAAVQAIANLSGTFMQEGDLELVLKEKVEALNFAKASVAMQTKGYVSTLSKGLPEPHPSNS